MSGFILKGKYALHKKIKQDRIGWLWSASLRTTGAAISVREYRPNFCHPSIVQKIQDAVLQTAELKHPNIVRIIDSVFTPDKRFFIVYDTPYQGSLTEVLQRIKKFPLYDSQKIILEIARALEHAHQRRCLHGALNPENIDILANGEIKLRNFYIDQLLNSFLLAKGQNLLNTAYLAPEQIRGEPLSKATDVLALGALFYLLLSGRPPYPVITSLPQILKNYLRAPEKLTIILPDIPLYIEDIIGKALQQRARHRQQSIAEFVGDLRQKKVTIAVEELKRRDAAGPPPGRNKSGAERPATPAASPPVYANPPDNDNIWQTRVKNLAGRHALAMPKEETPAQPPEPPESFLEKDSVHKLLVFALLGVFAGLLALFINALFFNSFNSAPRIEIPDVLRLPRDTAVLILENQGLRVQFGGYVDNPDITPNYIVETKPAAGRIVKKGRIVVVYAGQQTEGLSAPNLIEHTLQSAGPLAADRGLTINVVEQVYSNKYIRHQIISQSPLAGETVKRGDKINVTVSDGYPVRLSVKEKTADQITVTLFMQNEPDWEPQNVVVYLQDRKNRRKYAEKFLQPGDKDRLEISADASSVIEVYYFNDLAFKAELKYLNEPE